MPESKDFKYETYNGVILKPGIQVFCDDRDSGWWDASGIIKDVWLDGFNYAYKIDFGHTDSVLLGNQIAPVNENTEEAIQWRMERNLKIFLCHGSEDKSKVREIFQALKKAEMRPWLDEEALTAGDDWEAAIRKAIKDCHVILVLLSTSSVSKEGYIQREIKFALDRAEEMPEGRIFIIPVRLDNCKPPDRLQRWHRLDYFDSEASPKLIETLRKHAKNIAIK